MTAFPGKYKYCLGGLVCRLWWAGGTRYIHLSVPLIVWLPGLQMLIPLQGCTDVKAVAVDHRKLEPYVVIVEEGILQAYLVVDNHIIADQGDMPLTLMAAIFVNDICSIFS